MEKCVNCENKVNPADFDEDEDEITAAGGMCFDCADAAGLLYDSSPDWA